MSEGDLIIGNCKLTTCLATGSQTQVWEVVEQGSNEKYAMKLLLPEAFKDPIQKAALKFEAKVMATLDHPNVVKFKSVTFDKKNGFMLMELFRAPNLKAQMQTDLLSIHVRLKRLVEQVSQGMAHIHDKGWLHKDLKPDNILFSKSAELRIIDFSLAAKPVSGLAALMPKGKKLIQGTRNYMAPEQIKCQRLGFYTDIYNFGVTLFELLTGRTPFAGFTPNDLLKKHLSDPAPAPSQFNSNVTPEMDRVVLKMLAKKPEQRQKTFNELLAEIRNVTFFKEDPQKVMEQRALDKENEGLKEASLNERRDSRTDARLAEMAKAAAAEAANAPPAPPAAPTPIQIPAAAAAVPVARPQPPVPTGAVPPRPGVPPVPPGAPGRPPQSIPVGMPPPRPGMPPGALPPGVRPPPPMPPGQPPRPGIPPGAMPVPPGGAPRPPGAPVPPGALPPGMPPRPGVPAVAGPGGPPRPMPPPGVLPPNAPRPGGPGMPPGGGPPRPPMPPGPPPRPGVPPVPGGQLPPGVRPPGPVPPGGPRPPGPPGRQPPPRPPVPPPAPAGGGDASLDDFNVS